MPQTTEYWFTWHVVFAIVRIFKPWMRCDAQNMLLLDLHALNSAQNMLQDL